MKRLLIILFALCLGFSSAWAQLGFGARIEGGVSLSKVQASLHSVDLGAVSSTGYRLGLTAELPLAPSLYFAPGLALKSNSTEYSEPELVNAAAMLNTLGIIVGSGTNLGDLVKAGESRAATYALLPINLGFRLGLGSVGLSVEVGPYGGYAINHGAYSSRLLEEAGFKLNRLSYGLGASVALRLKSTYVRVGYEHELSDKFSVKNTKLTKDEFKFQDKGFYVTLGYRF